MAEGPQPCINGEPDNGHGVGPACGEPVVLRGTSTYCQTCGRCTGMATVVFPESDDDLQRMVDAQREEDRGTALEYIWTD